MYKNKYYIWVENIKNAMEEKGLGKIEQVDLRKIWKHEALDYTNWLAESDNIQALAEKIGIDMHVIKTEANVGGFSADILAEESNTGKKIIIENQLETTNHDHLGKLITYASGLEANYIIWIFKEIREEHRRAIDWLNEITDEALNIFAIKMEVWKIGDSLPAPVFNIVCAPNDWQKAYRKSNSSQNLTDNNLVQLNFWEGFSQYIASHKSPFRPRKAQPQHWYDVSIGTSQAHISFVVSLKDNYIRAEIYIPKNKELFMSLYDHKSEIEQKLGFAMDWQELPAAKASRIAISYTDIDVREKDNVGLAYKWLLETGAKMSGVFKTYIV